MLEFDNLEQALLSLSKSVSNFPIGAVSLDDFKPTEERIKETRKSLKTLNARLLMLKAQNEYQTIAEEPEDYTSDTSTELNDATADILLKSMAIKLGLHSFTIQAILAGKQGDRDMQEKIYACMRKLFTLNDIIMSLQKEIEDAVEKRLDLKSQCQGALLDYKQFLKEQEEISNKKLQETNPEIALNKERTIKAIRSINIMKKLIVDFIGASNHMLKDNPVLVEMLEEHRGLINIDTILKISQVSIRGNVEIED